MFAQEAMWMQKDDDVCTILDDGFKVLDVIHHFFPPYIVHRLNSTQMELIYNTLFNTYQ